MGSDASSIEVSPEAANPIWKLYSEYDRENIRCGSFNASDEDSAPERSDWRVAFSCQGAVVILGITARFGWGRRWHRLLADVYSGYDKTTSGLIVGAVWAFVDGLSGGYAFYLLYDRLQQGMR